MTRITLSLAIAAALLTALPACQRAQAPAEPVAQTPAEAAASEPAVAPAVAAASEAGALEDGGSFSGGIAAADIAAASQGGQGYAGTDAPNLDALKAAVDRVQQANERLRQAEANKPGASGAPVAPAAPTAPAGGGLPPVQFKVTGDTIVPKAPELANDVFRGMQRVFATSAACNAITGIDTRAVSAEGPFNKDATGKLVSGTIVERWTVSGCGKTASYYLTLAVQPDSTVRYAITAG